MMSSNKLSTASLEAHTGPGAEGIAAVPGATGSSSSQTATGVHGASSALNASYIERRRQKKKYAIKKLEKKLENYHRQIKKFNEEEVSMDEMLSSNSAYLKEDYLKRKFLATWEELCMLLKQSSAIEVTHESADISYSGTSYPEVNRRVQRLLRSDEFPDYIDICDLIERSNTKHNLGISSEEKTEMSRKVFKEVGKMIKSRRIEDYRQHFGSHLTDAVKIDNDPAKDDRELEEQLKKSLEDGKEKMKSLVEKYVVVEQELELKRGGDGSPQGDSCNSHDEDDDEEEEERELETEGEVDSKLVIEIEKEDDGRDSEDEKAGGLNDEEVSGNKSYPAKRMKLDEGDGNGELNREESLSSSGSTCSSKRNSLSPVVESKSGTSDGSISIDVETVEECPASSSMSLHGPEVTTTTNDSVIALSDSDSDVVIISASED